MPRLATNKAAHRPGRQPVHILLRRDQFQHSVGVQPLGQRELHQDPVDAGIGSQAPDRLLHLALGGVGTQLDMARHHGRLRRLALLVPHVYATRLVVAHQHRGQADLGATCRSDLRVELGDDLVPQPVAVHENRPTPGPLKVVQLGMLGHRPPVGG